MEPSSPIFDDPTTADLVLVIEDQLVHVHKKFLEKKFKNWRKLFPRGNDNNNDDDANLEERVQITDYNYDTIYQYLRFHYQNEVKFTENNWESLLRLSIQYPNSRLRKLCYENLEKRGILDLQQFGKFPPSVRTDYVENVDISMGNLKGLLRLTEVHFNSTSKLEQRCREFLLNQKGKVHMHRCYKWAKQFERFRPIGDQLLAWASEHEFALSNCFTPLALGIQAKNERVSNKFFKIYLTSYKLFLHNENILRKWWLQVPLTLDICFEMFDFLTEFSPKGWVEIALDKVYAKLDRELDKLGEHFKISKMVNYCMHLKLFQFSRYDNDKVKQMLSELMDKFDNFVQNRYHWPNSNKTTCVEAIQIVKRVKLERAEEEEEEEEEEEIDDEDIEGLLIRDNLVSTLKNIDQINSNFERIRFYKYFSFVFHKLRSLKLLEVYVDYSESEEEELEFFHAWPLKILLEFCKHSDVAVKQFFGPIGLDDAIQYKIPDHFIKTEDNSDEDITIVADFIKQNIEQDDLTLVSRITISFENLTTFCNESFLECKIMDKVESFVFKQLNSPTGFDAYRTLVNMKKPLIDQCIDQWAQNVYDISTLNYPLKLCIARERELEVEKVCENVETFLVDLCTVDDSTREDHRPFWREWFHKVYQSALELKFERLQTKTFDFFTRHFESPCNEHCKAITHFYDLPRFYEMAHKHNCQSLLGLFKEFFISKFPSKPYLWYAEVISRHNGRLRTLIEEQLLKDLTDRQELKEIYQVAQINDRFEANPALKTQLKAIIEKCNKSEVITNETTRSTISTKEGSNKRRWKNGYCCTAKCSKILKLKDEDFKVC